jgi:hypothetical protein
VKQIPVLLLGLAGLVLGGLAQAEDDDERLARSLLSQATEHHIDGQEADKAGDYAEACDAFGRAHEVWRQAINVYMHLRSTRNYTYESSQAINGSVDNALRNESLAGQRKSAACAKAQAARRAEAPAVSPIQSAINRAQSLGQTAADQGRSRDFANSCQSARAATALWIKARNDYDMARDSKVDVLVQMTARANRAIDEEVAVCRLDTWSAATPSDPSHLIDFHIVFDEASDMSYRAKREHAAKQQAASCESARAATRLWAAFRDRYKVSRGAKPGETEKLDTRVRESRENEANIYCKS